MRSLLGDLIAQATQAATQQEPPAPSLAERPGQEGGEERNVSTKKTSSRTSRLKPKSGHDDDRKPAAKRKRRVNFGDDGHQNIGSDDDSLYRSDEENASLQDAESHHDDPRDDLEASDLFQEQYSNAFRVIYGPSHVPAVAAITQSNIQELREALVPNGVAPPGIQYTSVEDRKQPRFLRRRNKKTKQWETTTETPEEAARRFHRQARAHERSWIERRWQLRSFDMRKEPDVGRAMYRRTKRQLEDKVREELREKFLADKAREHQERSVKQDEANIDEDEESVQEQQGVLERLTQTSIDATSNKTAAVSDGLSMTTGHTTDGETEDEWTRGDLSVAYEERMDYWMLGYAVPRPDDIEISHNAPEFRPQLKPGQLPRDPDENDGGLRLPHRKARGTQEESDWSPSYFPSSKRSRYPRFFQYRRLQALAARYLCGGSFGEDQKMEDRFLRLLFSPLQHEQSQTLAQFSRDRTLLLLSHQLGSNALLFAKHIWSNPMEVARMLGLLPDSIMESHFLAGRHEIPHRMQEYMSSQRSITLRNYKISRQNWILSADGEDLHIKSEDEGGGFQTFLESTEDSIEKRSEETSPNAGGVQTDVVALKVEDATDKVPAMNSVQLGGQNVAQEAGLQNAIDPEEEKTVTSNIHETKDENNSKSGTTAGGVVLDRKSEQNATTTNVSDTLDFTDVILPPTTNFAHVPGTSPPAPQFPLGPVGIIFGPPDFYAKYHHQDNIVHHGHFVLALSTLMSRAASVDHSTPLRHIQKKIQLMLDGYVSLTNNKGHRRQFVFSKGKIQDVPSVQLYRAILTYCSYWANAFPGSQGSGSNDELKSEQGMNTIKEEDSDAGGDDFYAACDGGVVTTSNIANHLYGFLETRIQHNGLARFPRLRLIFALAQISRKLPSGAAEILAQPLNENDCPTPIHIMRKAIEFLEYNGLIRSGREAMHNHGEAEESVRDGEFEYMFVDFAENLKHAVKVVPTDAEYHAWYIGSLAASLLLSSGNRIGSGAHKYPSHATPMLGLDRVGSRRDRLEHEVREKLQKFHETRFQISAAIRTLLALAEHQPGSRINAVVMGILGWKQVIALTVGDKLDNVTQAISSLYNHHAYSRYAQEMSKEARASVQGLNSLDFHARELENDPSCIDKWRNFVKALGPVGVEIGNKIDEDHRKKCLHCQLVRTPRLMDHAFMERSSGNWWGKDRHWWCQSLLHIQDDGFKARVHFSTEAVMLKLEQADVAVAPLPGTTPISENAGTTSNQAWLPTRTSCSHERHATPTKADRATAYDNLLPPGVNADPSDVENDYGDEKGFEMALRGISPALEAACYKVFIYCHLVGPGDPIVERRIYPLIRDCWEFKKRAVKDDSAQFRVLSWLYQAGIDIPKMARLQYPERPQRRRR